MTATRKRRRLLEEAIREALRKAYLHGALQMSLEGSVPLGYPGAGEATARVLAVAFPEAGDGR